MYFQGRKDLFEGLKIMELPYHTEGRRVVKVGVQFDRDTMTVGEYLIENN